MYEIVCIQTEAKRTYMLTPKRKNIFQMTALLSTNR